MRVLRISHSATIAAWRGRERALRAAGDEVTLITAPRWHAGGVWADLDAAPDEQVRPARTFFGRHPALFLYAPGPLWRALGERWDVIDIHEEPFALSTAEVLLLRLLRRNRTPVVLYTAQNLDKRYPVPFRWLERLALRAASGISACNTDAARIVEAKGFPGRARVIPLGVDPVEDAAERSSAPRPAVDAVTVGLVGRLVPEKGVVTLLNALRTDSRLHARIAGAGSLAAELPDLVAERGLQERVELLGAIPPSEMGAFYRSIDVLAVPSIPTARWTEQFGRVAVEAMASGVPVVSSDAGALPDVVGGAGIVVPAGDPAALASAVMEASGERRTELVAAGLVRAGQCSWESVADAYRELYTSVTARAGTLPGGRPAAGAEPPGERRTTHQDTADSVVARQLPGGSETVGTKAGAGPGLEIIVVAYGAVGMLRRALSPVAGLPVTVIDNSSLPGIAALCAELGVRYRDAGANLGFGAAVNLALADRLVPGGDVLLLNPDAEIGAEGIAHLQAALRADHRLASVGPAQVDPKGRRARVEWPFPAPHRSWLEAVGLGRLSGGARFVIGSVLLLRAEALAQVGGFDERFFLYAEETDWAYRAHLLGWRHAAVPEVQAVHAAGGTSSDPRRREAHFFASQERYFRKHFGAAGWQSARLAAILGSTVRALLQRGEKGIAARRRAALYRLGPVRVEKRFRGAG